MSNDQWVVIELNPRGEKEDPDLLRQSICNVVKGAEIFVPASISKVGEDKVIRYLVEGYVFIRRTHQDSIYFRLEGSKYVQTVLTRPSQAKDRQHRSTREIAWVPSTEIDRMRKQIRVDSEQGIEIGDTVRVTSGAYKSILGTIIEEIPEKDSVQVHIKLRSKEAIVTLPRSFLRFESKRSGPSPRVIFNDTSSKLREWYNQVRYILRYQSEGINQVSKMETSWDALNSWVEKYQGLTDYIQSHQTALNFLSVKMQWLKYHLIEGWESTWGALYRFVSANHIHLNFDPITTEFSRWNLLNGFSRRLEDISSEVDRIERIITCEPHMIQNIIIDGHNLAIRCLHATASNDTLSSRGRPTGMVYGFVRSLASFRKRFPDAEVWVCWDGSSQRRKAMFSEYKANRTSSYRANGVEGGWDQLSFLRDFLPLLGVKQVTNPQEESDDLIATLVKKPLRGQRNVIISTDHDFLQLVTPTDVLLIPKVGSRPETMYDEDKVSTEYGVEPSRMVHLRALQGDTSDNIPGVPRVPGKILTALLKSHKTIGGIYSSNLAGLTKLQYEKLKNAEKQVRLNVDLMTLREVDYDVHATSVDESKAEDQLVDLDIQPEPILAAFFAKAKGFAKTG